MTVVIPVGPSLNACRWIGETLESVADQTEDVNILLIDDMHGIREHKCVSSYQVADSSIWKAPWRLGVAHAFNFGVALAPTELVIMLGADDTLEPTAAAHALRAWDQHGIDAYYYFGVRYMDTGEEQTLACGEAMVSKGLWRKTGGFPVESEVGACDAALISIMMVHFPELLVPIANGKPLVNYRRHADTDTASRGEWQGPILIARHLLTKNFVKPDWGRYA